MNNTASCGGGTDVQNGDDDSVEVVTALNTTASPVAVDVFIDGFFAAEARRLEIFVLGDVVVNEFVVAGGSVFGHPAVTGALAVGAIDASDPGNDAIEAFSSLGPADVYFSSFSSRTKPDLAAIDGVAVTGAGTFPSPFFGTSAAAPHVAGVAALVFEAVKEAQPGISRTGASSQVFDALRDTAVDLGDAGLDQAFGAGRVDALAAAQSIPSAEPVPALSTWAMVALGVALGGLLLVRTLRRGRFGG